MEEGEQYQADKHLLSVSTAVADYFLHPGSHQRTTHISEKTLQRIDGLVLESGMVRYEDLCLEEFRKNRQYTDAVGAAMARERNIFVVDVPYACSDARVFLGEAGAKLALPFLAGLAGVAHAHVGFGLLTLPAIAFCAGDANQSSLLNQLASYAQFSNAYNSFGFRSAVAAEKLEQFVAPRLEEETGSRPTILLDYGAGHLDIAAYLQHPRIRKSVLRFGGRTLRSTLDMERVHTICEFHTVGGTYEKVLHEASF